MYTLKNALLIFSLMALTGCTVQSTAKTGNMEVTRALNPTGTYVLNESKEDEKGDFYGYQGTIYVKKISGSRIEMGFSAIKGAPSYNSGSFVETLAFKDNSAVYTYKSCRIIFTFTEKAIEVTQDDSDDTDSDCGFGHGVYAHGTYYKTSSKTPKVRNPMEY